MRGPERADVGWCDRFGEGASRAQVGDQYRLARVEELRRLGHEVDAGKHDDVRLHVDGLAGQCEGVAHDVGDPVEDLRGHVVVGEDHRVALLLEPHDGVHVVCHGCPLHGRHGVRHLRVQVGCSQRSHRVPLPGSPLMLHLSKTARDPLPELWDATTHVRFRKVDSFGRCRRKSVHLAQERGRHRRVRGWCGRLGRLSMDG